jgi:carbamoyltransferase
MNILGINAYHGDVSAVLVRDGELVAAVEEERFRRIKHIGGFPAAAIRACLEMANVAPTDIQHVGVSRNPRANLLKKATFTLTKRP